MKNPFKTSEGKWNKKKIGNWAGRILMVLSFILIGVSIAQYDIDFSMLNLRVALLMLPLLLVYGLNVLAASWNYDYLLRRLIGKSTNRALVVSIYGSSQMYKYIPGNIMHFVGRNRLALQDDNLKHDEVALSTLTETAFLMVGGLVVSLASVWEYFLSYIQQAGFPTLVLIVVGIVCVLVVCLVIMFRKKLKDFLHRYVAIVKRMRPLLIIGQVAFAALRLVILAAIYIGVLWLLGQPLTLEIIPKVGGLFVMSWLIGFITPGAPGGLGIREAIMIMFLGGTLQQSILLSSTIIYRIFCILGDLLAWGFTSVCARLLIRAARNN